MGIVTDPRRLIELIGKERATIGEVIAARAAASPNAAFVTCGSRSWSYREGWTLSLRFAGFLGSIGLCRSRVAVFLPKCPEALWTWFGSAASGTVFLALNYNHRADVLQDMIDRSGADLLVTDRNGWQVVGPMLPRACRHVVITDGPLDQPLPAVICHSWREIAAHPVVKPSPVLPSDPATLLYTSGTTGRSKAVLLPHNLYCRGAAWLAESFGYHPADTFHDWMPLWHIGGQLHVTMSAVMAGSSLVQFRSFSRRSFWDEVKAARATIFCGFASILSLLMEAHPSDLDSDHPLRVGLVGNMSAEVKEAFERRFAVRLLDTYGMTECEPLTLPTDSTPPGSCGLPCPDFEIAIMDDEDQPMPAGSAGRICVRPRNPDMMMQEYEGDGPSTVRAWRNLWFRTSDRGRLDGRGYLYFIERMASSIRRGGENISVSDVEQVILSHPEILAAAVVGVPDRVMGEEIKVAVIRRPGCDVSEAELHDFMSRRLAPFMVPRFIDFVVELPYTDVGKLKRDDLAIRTGHEWDARSALP
jgi:crotonobetaine/carnitine-CoA ligase